jgi:hypothetical protein
MQSKEQAKDMMIMTQRPIRKPIVVKGQEKAQQETNENPNLPHKVRTPMLLDVS